jgi:hypothetical protein
LNDCRLKSFNPVTQVDDGGTGQFSGIALDGPVAWAVGGFASPPSTPAPYVALFNRGNFQSASAVTGSFTNGQLVGAAVASGTCFASGYTMGSSNPAPPQELLLAELTSPDGGSFSATTETRVVGTFSQNQLSGLVYDATLDQLWAGGGAVSPGTADGVALALAMTPQGASTLTSATIYQTGEGSPPPDVAVSVIPSFGTDYYAAVGIDLTNPQQSGSDGGYSSLAVTHLTAGASTWSTPVSGQFVRNDGQVLARDTAGDLYVVTTAGVFKLAH